MGQEGEIGGDEAMVAVTDTLPHNEMGDEVHLEKDSLCVCISCVSMTDPHGRPGVESEDEITRTSLQSR